MRVERYLSGPGGLFQSISPFGVRSLRGHWPRAF